MRLSSHSFCTRLSEIPHFLAASETEIYSNILYHILSHNILYTDFRIISTNRLRIICSVSYSGKKLEKMSEKELTKFRRDNTAYIFQQYYLLPHLNVEKNVRMGADLSHNKEYLSMIDAVGLSEKCRKFPSELSGGEQQRVAIARALAKKPQVLFLDEPTGALDEKTGRQVLDYIINLQREQGFTMIMVTHNENIAETADRIIRMNSGRIISVTENTGRKTAYEIGW